MFLVAYPRIFSGISLKGYWDFWFCKFCKAFLVFCTKVVTEVIRNLIMSLDHPRPRDQILMSPDV